MYAPGEVVHLFADLFPGQIIPRPDGVPTGVKLRILITERMLTLAWRAGSTIHRFDLEMTEQDTAQANFRGGQVGDYRVALAGGCKCGMGSLSSWTPYQGVTLIQEPRLLLAQRDANRPSQYGIPSPRYSVKR